MSDLESKRLEDDALEDVNGGSFSNLIFRGMGWRRKGKLSTLEQTGDDGWTLSTLEQKNHKGNGMPQEGFSGMSKL